MNQNQNQKSFIQWIYWDYMMIWSHMSMQNNGEGSITKWWWGSLFIYILHAMYPSRLLGPHQLRSKRPHCQIPWVPRPTRSVAYVDHVGLKFDRQLSRAAAVMYVQSRSDWKKSKTRILQPRKKSCGRTTIHPAKECPDVLYVEMASYCLINIGSGNGLFPIKLLSEPLLMFFIYVAL